MHKQFNVPFTNLLTQPSNKSEFLLQIQPKDECVRALTKMSNCPACQGLPEVQPCRGYCINVMKGCLAFHSELSDSWNKFIGKNSLPFVPKYAFFYNEYSTLFDQKMLPKDNQKIKIQAKSLF